MAETDQEVGPTSKKKSQNVRYGGGRTEGRLEREGKIFYKFFSLFVSFSDLRNLIVGFRWDKHKKCSTRRGLRVGTEIQDFTENSGKKSKNPKFLVFLRFTAF